MHHKQPNTKHVRLIAMLKESDLRMAQITRRKTLVSVGGLLAGSGVVSEAAFADSTSSDADLRVVVESGLALLPARENENYVETDDNDRVEAITLAHEDAKPNQRATTVFENLVDLQNNGDTTVEGLSFSFEVDGTANDEDIADALRVVSGGEVLEDGDDLFQQRGDIEELGPGETLSFGLRLNLVEGVTEISSDTDVTIVIDPE